MKRREARIQRFIEQILSTEPFELDCLGVLDIVERYVDWHAAGRDPSHVAPGIPLHLKQCPDCSEMYDVLVDLAKMEASDLLPDVDALWRDLAGMTAGSASSAQGIGAGASTTPAFDIVAGAALRPARTADSALGPRRGSAWMRSLRSFFFGAGADPLSRAGSPHLPRRALGTRWSLPALALPSLAALLLGLGWWRADQNADTLGTQLMATRANLDLVQGEVAASATMIAGMGGVDRLKFGHGRDGAWVRVLYNPAADEAMVFMGRMPRMGSGQRLVGWLVRPGEPPESTGTVPDDVMQAAGYWKIPCDAELSDDTTFMLTLEPGSTPVVQVALGP